MNEIEKALETTGWWMFCFCFFAQTGTLACTFTSVYNAHEVLKKDLEPYVL